METRQQILTEARELFLEDGLAGFSMRAVASRVGVSATALYRHFNDKDALLASLLSEAFATFGSYLGRALGGRTPIERFRAIGLAYVDFALDHPRDYELMFLTNCAELGFKRQIHVIVPDLIAVPWLLRNSDLVTAVAMSTAKRLAKLGGLHIVSAPEEMQRSNQVMMLWHERDNGDPAKAWLRRTLRELAGGGASAIRAAATS